MRCLKGHWRCDRKNEGQLQAAVLYGLTDHRRRLSYVASMRLTLVVVAVGVLENWARPTIRHSDPPDL